MIFIAKWDCHAIGTFCRSRYYAFDVDKRVAAQLTCAHELAHLHSNRHRLDATVVEIPASIAVCADFVLSFLTTSGQPRILPR